MGAKYQFQQGVGSFEDNNLVIDYSLRKVSFPLHEITGFYRYKSFGMDTLQIASRQPDGKIKSQPILLGRENVPEDFVDRLITLAPKSANLLHMSKKDALAQMGVAKRNRNAFIALIFLILFILGGIFFPQIYHYTMDRDLESVSVEEIYGGASPLSNFLTFSTTLPEAPLVVTYRKWQLSGSSFGQRQKKGFYPIVPADWEQGDPVKMVLMVTSGYELQNIAPHEGKEITVSGIVRNVLWERFSWSPYMSDLSRHIKSPIESPLVIEYNVSPSYDMLLYFGGTSLLIILFLGLAAWKDRRTDSRKS